MKKSKFTPNQIATILKEFDAGKKQKASAEEHGISKAAFYKWRQRYGGMTARNGASFTHKLLLKCNLRNRHATGNNCMLL